MTGVDRADPAAEQVGHAYTDYTQFLNADALDGARIGVWRELSFEIDGVAVDADVSAIMDETIAALEGTLARDPVDVEHHRLPGTPPRIRHRRGDGNLETVHTLNGDRRDGAGDDRAAGELPGRGWLRLGAACTPWFGAPERLGGVKSPA